MAILRKPEHWSVQGVCVRCEVRPQRPRGAGRYRATCRVCERQLRPPTLLQRQLAAKPYQRVRTDTCGRCGFVAEHICQMDVDHIDGDRSNGADDNLQTLCANCHRLKTWLAGDWKPKRPPA